MSTQGNDKEAFITIFGVSFKKEQIHDHYMDDGNPVYSRELIVDENDRVHEVAQLKLKDGTTVMFPKQNAENSAQIIQKEDGYVHFRRIDGLIVRDTPNDDKYMFNDCNNATIFAKREYTTTQGYMSGPGLHYKEVDFTRSYDKDVIKANKNCQNMKVYYTQGYDSFNPLSKTY